MEAVREIVHALGNVLCAIECALQQTIDATTVLRLVFGTHQVEIEREQRKLLADVVVQLAGDTCALRFLRAEQAATEIANPLVAGAQFLGAVARLSFSEQSPPLLNQQTDDESRLREQHDRGADDVLAEAIPE